VLGRSQEINVLVTGFFVLNLVC